ncbi:hypothetical protein ATK17_2964 [Branchiibius hedensis]|uniref:Uncharacterized protein n=1 Tax=Branchiibius hedensis TaxID=672460 RepID=A0A2Y9A096_9MICO|nr:hypothetical protein [Branchiibius hedensis]PWJ26786.1 hypothetical protein ATK17_2964 [Branchiibius hedensis]SSA35597.1 hypothetical protein SAMN04489750_2964 [Branchiibius hedensis]
MTRVVSHPARTANAALELGATITAACLSLLMVLVPAGVVLGVVSIFPGIPADVAERLRPLLFAGLAVYACVFAVGLALLIVGRAARHHRHS